MWPFTRLRYRYHRLPGCSSSIGLHRSPIFSFLLVFFGIYFIAVLSVRHYSRRDPTSPFFDPNVGYKPNYSTFRRQQADDFVKDSQLANASSHLIKFDESKKEEALCIGIATIARDDVRYFKSAVGSILEGLHPQERQRIHLILFIAHTDPSVHPAFSEPWLHKLADQVLLYNASLSGEEIDHLQWLELDKERFREKALFDYTYLLKACSDVDTPYTIILEDDIIAMDGWFHRTDEAVAEVADKSPSCKRLFDTFRCGF
jgi:hypothetical protein